MAVLSCTHPWCDFVIVSLLRFCHSWCERVIGKPWTGFWRRFLISCVVIVNDSYVSSVPPPWHAPCSYFSVSIRESLNMTLLLNLCIRSILELILHISYSYSLTVSVQIPRPLSLFQLILLHVFVDGCVRRLPYPIRHTRLTAKAAVGE